MSKNTKVKPLFERLKSSLEEGIRFAQGNQDLRTRVHAEPAPELGAREIVLLRQRLALTQHAFASTLNVSPKTVQSWEQGIRRPSQAALRLLQLLSLRPDLVREMGGM